MAEPRITGISIAEAERDRAAGIVARFSFDLGPMRVRGCALARRRRRDRGLQQRARRRAA
ncbi:MAG: hypothetical protein PGN25_05860 [Methylorubrum populi]